MRIVKRVPWREFVFALALVLPSVFLPADFSSATLFSVWAQQAPQAPIGDPGERYCCSLGFAQGLDPTKLGGHKYGNSSTVTDVYPTTAAMGEPVGYVYTSAAGLVDIGHVRDNADMVLWVYDHLLNGQHSIGVGGDTVGVATIPTVKDQMLALAGAITYVSSWSHELGTWGDTELSTALRGKEDYSAFSPEDLSSNIVGIKIATEAILAGGAPSSQDFDTQMNIELPKLILSLGGQPEDVTNKLLTQVQFIPGGKDLTGKWWMDDPESPVNGKVRLLRRNFDGAAWKIAGAPQADTPGWLSNPGFTDHYSQFLYVMRKYADATQVPLTNDYALQPPGSRILIWSPIPSGVISSTSDQVTDALGNFQVIDQKTHQPVSNGQFADVKVNQYPNLTPEIFANMKDATAAIRKVFVALNKGMDGP
jgi:hypothetical protein